MESLSPKVRKRVETLREIQVLFCLGYFMMYLLIILYVHFIRFVDLWFDIGSSCADCVIDRNKSCFALIANYNGGSSFNIVFFLLNLMLQSLCFIY